MPSKFFSSQELYFPTITVCNLNQVEASRLEAMGVYGNKSRMDAVFDEFIIGRKGDISEKEQNILDSLGIHSTQGYEGTIEMYYSEFSFLEANRQPCNDLFLSMKFKERKLTWSDLPLNEEWGPFFYGTDYGACCYFSPHVEFDP